MFNIKELSENIISFDTPKVCAIIVAAKYFGNNIDVIRLCMQHLAIRRAQGEEFDFENYITEEYNKLPQLQAGKFDVQDLLKGLRKL